jgi:hydrogenase expression/formation protein HypD
VTSQADIDNGISVASIPNVTVASFGDMLRLTDSNGYSLYQAKADGADVRIVYSPLDIIKPAMENPDRQFVFLAVGFETTTPMAAGLIKTAHDKGLKNISAVAMCKTMPEVLSLLLSDPSTRIDGFICPGNVSIITGLGMYEPLVQAGKAAVVAGFESVDLLLSILGIIRQINADDYKVVNNYMRVCTTEGNKRAQELTNEVFTPVDARWRGIGVIPMSGLAIREKYAEHDAAKIFNLDPMRAEKPTACRCGDVLKGSITPFECPLFGKVCTPEKAVGPCMVSSEGACAAHYKYGS